jgi:hypothetical protein
MFKQRRRSLLDGALLAIMALLVLGGLIALGFLQGLSRENRALFVIAGSIGILACFTGLLFISEFRKWLRKRVWRRAISAWRLSSQAAAAPSFVLKDSFSDEQLNRLAIQVYSWIGYRLVHKQEKGLSLQFINPDGEIELVTCKQHPALIKLHHVYSLELEMKRFKAVRGFFWAPAGFTSEAIDWATGRPIILADRQEIGRLLECAHTQGSRFLEY